MIRFHFVVFDTASGRFVSRPAQFVPIRAFDSDRDAASFLDTARAYRSQAGPTLSIDRGAAG